MPADPATCTFQQQKKTAHADTVLIVEDDDDLVTLLEYRLRDEGFIPLIATNGNEACQLLETNVPIDLVLLDILLPIKDGWDVCRFIRSHPEPRVAGLPVIMLSALSASENRIKGIECGADAYLAKPYSVQEVILSCRKMINERRDRRRLELEVKSLREQEENSTATRQMLFHEIRSQFTVIGGLCQRLLNCSELQLAHTKGKDYLQVIGHSINQVSEMADEMLLLAKLDNAKQTLTREHCRLDEIVTDIVPVHLQTAQRKMVTINVSPLPENPVILHRLALKVIISSLLENAVKYCPPSSVVTLGVMDTGTKVHLMVQDQGPGIPLHEQQMIFTPYYRGEITRDSHRGTGLGLYSVKRLTQELGGEVRLTSAPGEGSIFLITFNIQQSSRNESPGHPS